MYWESVDWAEFPWGLNPCWYTERQGCPQGELWVWVSAGDRQMTAGDTHTWVCSHSYDMWRVSHHARSSAGQCSAERQKDREIFFFLLAIILNYNDDKIQVQYKFKLKIICVGCQAPSVAATSFNSILRLRDGAEWNFIRFENLKFVSKFKIQ